MAPVESQLDRNRELFGLAFRVFTDTVVKQGLQGPWEIIHLSWFSGGSAAAAYAVEHCDTLRNAWGRGDEGGAVRLTIPFSMPMVVRFCRWNPTMGSPDIETRLRNVAAGLTNVVHIFTDSPLPEGTVDEYVEIAKQFEFEEDAILSGKVPHYFIEMDYILSCALIVLGRKSKFSLGDARLPVPSLYEFSRQGGVLGQDPNDFSSHAAMFEAVHFGVGVAGETFQTAEKTIGG